MAFERDRGTHARTRARTHEHTHAQMKLVQDGVVVALVKLIGVENSTAHRLVSGCLANLTTRRDVTWELLQANGHQVGFG